MTEFQKIDQTKHIARRYAAERRFKAYGLFALMLTTAFLAFLLFDITSKSLPAFFQYHAVTKVTVDPAKVDPSDPAKGDFEGLARAAWRANFPTISTRADRRQLNGLMSNGAGDELRKRVIADPSLIGKEIEVPLMLSDDADLHFKGNSTAVERKDGSGNLTVTVEGDNIFLQGQGLETGNIVIAGNAAYKVAPEGLSAPVEIITPVDKPESVAQGAWQVLSFSTPETERKLSDKETVWLEQFAQTGKVERHFAWNLFTSGDSREAELAGLLGSLIGSLLVLLVTVSLALPIGVAAAIYLEEFAPKNRITEIIEVNINNLAAVPSVIFGLLGLAVFLNFFGMPRSVPLVGGLVIALMSLPTIIIASRAAIRAVPPSIREAALGVGASKQQAVFHHVLPLAVPGILTGTILAIANALGETAPLLMIGMVAFIADVPTGFFDSATVLPVQIYLWSDLPEKAFEARTAAAIVVLLVVLLALNAIAIFLRKKFERRW